MASGMNGFDDRPGKRERGAGVGEGVGWALRAWGEDWAVRKAAESWKTGETGLEKASARGDGAVERESSWTKARGCLEVKGEVTSPIGRGCGERMGVAASRVRARLRRWWLRCLWWWW